MQTMDEIIEPIQIDPQTFLKQHQTLPALPSVITDIQNLISDENASINDIALIISTEPALVAQILKIVNSAYYSFPHEVVDVKLAVAYLGIHEVFRIVLSLSVLNSFQDESRTEFEEIWYHSIFTALCAKVLAQNYEPLIDIGELWTAAILHDVGKLVYLKFFPIHYRVLNRYCEENQCFFSHAEEFYNLPSSAYMGGLLCDHWKLPSKVKFAAEDHSLETLKTLKNETLQDSFTRVICLSNYIAHLITDEYGIELKEKITSAIMENLKLDESDFLILMGKMSELRVEAEKIVLG
ncbi:hypothetical protein BVY01_04755 [bacterium I07]|nr:hypothetical protein BVY01_04755 [bacterium I07]